MVLLTCKAVVRLPMSCYWKGLGVGSFIINLSTYRYVVGTTKNIGQRRKKTRFRKHNWRHRAETIRDSEWQGAQLHPIWRNRSWKLKSKYSPIRQTAEPTQRSGRGTRVVFSSPVSMGKKEVSEDEKSYKSAETLFSQIREELWKIFRGEPLHRRGEEECEEGGAQSEPHGQHQLQKTDNEEFDETADSRSNNLGAGSQEKPDGFSLSPEVRLVREQQPRQSAHASHCIQNILYSLQKCPISWEEYHPMISSLYILFILPYQHSNISSFQNFYFSPNSSYNQFRTLIQKDP